MLKAMVQVPMLMTLMQKDTCQKHMVDVLMLKVEIARMEAASQEDRHLALALMQKEVKLVQLATSHMQKAHIHMRCALILMLKVFMPMLLHSMHTLKGT